MLSIAVNSPHELTHTHLIDKTKPVFITVGC